MKNNFKRVISSRFFPFHHCSLILYTFSLFFSSFLSFLSFLSFAVHLLLASLLQAFIYSQRKGALNYIISSSSPLVAHHLQISSFTLPTSLTIWLHKIFIFMSSYHLLHLLHLIYLIYLWLDKNSSIIKSSLYCLLASSSNQIFFVFFGCK